MTAAPRNSARAETIDSLKAFGGMFTSNGILGYVEPLGFGISSLDSLLTAQECIQKSGFGCYRIVHDTFHHHIGPDDQKILGKDYDVFEHRPGPYFRRGIRHPHQRLPRPTPRPGRTRRTA